MTRILFVCLGNICRSPLAEGVFRHVLSQRGLDTHITVDSAGTGGWHVGAKPDPRSYAIASAHGVSLDGIKARKVSLNDFARFDLVLGMDTKNVEDLKAIASGPAIIDQFCAFALGTQNDIEDPYYGGPEGFETAYRLIHAASCALADKLAGDDEGVSG